MNPKSLLITILVAFVTVFATDFLIHQLWLGSTYKATASLWRPEAEMMAKMPSMLRSRRSSPRAWRKSAA